MEPSVSRHGTCLGTQISQGEKTMNTLKKFYYWLKTRRFGKCGKNVRIGRMCSFSGEKNIFIGNNVSIGRNNIFWSTNAKIFISDNVLFGPNVSIHTGNHDIRVLGKNIIDVDLREMGDDNFGDVHIGEDVWCGDGAKILKGVSLARGCVIGAGSVVTSDTEPYCIYAGVPAKKIGKRFDDDQIKKHEQMLLRKREEKR